MRDIKFRCWQIDDYDWEEKPIWKMIKAEDLAFENYEPLVDLLKSDPESEIFMQYTGLKDKNGKEIYEGDIYKTWYSRDTTGKDIVHIVEAVTFEIEEHREKAGVEILFLRNAEIIGNIYENPELLNSTPTDAASNTKGDNK